MSKVPRLSIKVNGVHGTLSKSCKSQSALVVASPMIILIASSYPTPPLFQDAWRVFPQTHLETLISSILQELTWHSEMKVESFEQNSCVPAALSDSFVKELS